MKSLFFLEVLNHFEEIARLRIATWTQHPHEAFRWPLRPATQLLESDRGVDVVAKDRLSGIEVPGEKAFLTLLVVDPSLLGRCDIAILALLRSAAEQNHDCVAVLAEVDAISRPEIDAVLEYAGTHALDVREVSQLQSTNCSRYFRGCCGVKGLKPACEGTRPCAVEVLKDRQHQMVTQA